jgi:hypothetical protein
MDLFPPVNDICVPNFSSREAKCKFAWVNMDNIGTVNGDQVTSQNLCDILATYGIGYRSQQLCLENEDPNFDNLPNLGVQTNILFSQTLQTKYTFNFPTDPRPVTSQVQPVTPEWVRTAGDSSVNTSSALIAGVKWA